MIGWIAAIGVWDFCWWLNRRRNRGVAYNEALAKARSLGRPLVVVGAPDAGMTSGYGCGDITVDIAPSSCPRHMQVDITKRIPLPDDSAVVLVSCVFECVDDFDAAMKEVRRVGGDHVYVVRVEPWTLSAFFYPGAKNLIVRT